MRPEEKIQCEFFKYLRLQYPNVVAISEASGLRVSTGMAMKLKRMRSDHTQLDVIILEPRGKYHGLVIELKAKNIFKKNGELLKDQHLHDQQKTIDLLNSKGYYATFACSLDEAIEVLDRYMNAK